VTRQRSLPHVDTTARAQGRRERGPLARKRWREFRWLTSTAVDAANAPGSSAWPWHGAGPDPFAAWFELCRKGIARRWWSQTDVRCLLRPLELRGLRVPDARALRGNGRR
jgi:hypothetical protein